MEEKEIFKMVGAVSKKIKTDVFVVGGFVRDQMLGTQVKKDLDFVVDGSGIEFAKAVAEHVGQEGGSLIEFPDFDTARFALKENSSEKDAPIVIGAPTAVGEIEFAGARKESYRSTSRKPQVEKATLDEDLSRRDFTVNAMARQVLSSGKLGDILDPFNGQSDLKNKILRTPLEPGETFSDDPLRMLRAARFAAQLNFTIEKETLDAMKKNARRLEIISAERIQEELLKLFAAPVPSVGLWILVDTGLMEQFLPEVNELSGVEEVLGYTHKDNLSHTFAVVDNIATFSSAPLLRLAGLLHDIAKPQTKKFLPGRGWTFDMHDHLGKKMVRDICRRLRISKKDTEYMAKLVRWHLQPIALMDEGITDSAVRRLIVNAGEELNDLLILCRSDITTGNQKKKERRLKNYDILEKRIAQVMEKDKMRAFQSPVRGEEIMQLCGLRPGPTVGKIKEAIEEAILEGEIPNEYEAARAYFETIKEKYLAEVQEWERGKV